MQTASAIPIRQLDTYDVAILDTLGEVNWLDEVFNSAPTQRYSLSASGGGDNGSFYLMGEYSSQEGVFKRQRYDKYLLRFNGDIGTKKFRVGNNISFSYTDRDVINSSGDGGGPGNELSGIRYALIAAPVFPIYDQNGQLHSRPQPHLVIRHCMVMAMPIHWPLSMLPIGLCNATASLEMYLQNINSWPT